MKTITISEMLAEMNKVDSIFSIKYRKSDGSTGKKHNVTLRNSSGRLTERKKYNRNGLISIYEPSTGNEREITIDLIQEFNGIRVVRPTDLL